MHEQVTLTVKEDTYVRKIHGLKAVKDEEGHYPSSSEHTIIGRLSGGYIVRDKNGARVIMDNEVESVEPPLSH